jgi:hypothetical protein
MELMSEVDFFARHLREVEQAYPGITGRRVIHETVRRMINALIVDLNQTSRSRRRSPRATSRMCAMHRSSSPSPTPWRPKRPC